MSDFSNTSIVEKQALNPKQPIRLDPIHAEAVRLIKDTVPVIPCFHAPDKSPATIHGFKDKSLDRSQIDRWFSSGAYSIGVCPADAGYVVIDCDKGHNPVDLEPLQPTFTVRTPSDGRHLYYRTDEEFGNGRWAPKVDIRSANGYVLAPPSPGYEIVDAREPAEFPAWAAARLQAPAATKAKPIDDNEPANAETVARAQAFLKGVSEDEDGWKVAVQLIRNFALSRLQATELWQDWQKDFAEQWPDDVIEEKLDHAARFGQAEPGRDAAPAGTSQEAFGAALASLPAAQWGEPVDLFGSITPEPVLTRDMLPPVIADFAYDVAERIGIDPAVVVGAMLATCAATVDDEIQIQPKVSDYTWLESTRLNFLIAAPVGAAKSPAIRAATKPLKMIDARWQKEDAQKIAHWEDAAKLREATLKHIEKEIRSSGPYTPEAQNPLLPELERPAKRRLVINDTTTEGVCRILRDNPRGLLLEVDEAMGWISSFDVYRNGASGKDRAFWLQADNGGPYAKDRADEKASFLVPNLSVSIVGGIQPEKLRAIAKNLHDDGLIQRAFVIIAGNSKRGVDRAPNQRAEEAYTALLARLVDLRPAMPVVPITLDQEAQAYRIDVEDLAQAFIDLPGTPAAFRQHLAKWPGRFARLLLLFHVIEGGGREVSGQTAARVRDFMVRYLLPQQSRFYTEYFLNADEALDDAQWVAGYILAHSSERVTVSEISRAYHCSDDYRIRGAMEVLGKAAWVGEQVEDRAKRSTSWPVNPKIHTLFADRALAERQRREETQRRIKEAAAKVKDAGYR